jgi:WD40 repeat protein
VNAVAAVPDGKRALSASRDKTLELWNLESGRRLRKFEGHGSSVTAVAVLPDGKRALSGSDDKTLKLWDLETGQCLRTFARHTGRVTAIAVLPDGKRAVSGNWKTFKFWNLETGECLRTFEGDSCSVNTFALSVDGKRALERDDRTLRVWDLETGRCLGVWESESGVACCAAALDVVVISTADGRVLALRLISPGRVEVETTAAAWHPSRPLLATARANGSLLLQAWHPESQHLEEIARTSIPSITSVQWSPDGAYLLAATRNGATHILDSTTLQPAAASADWAPSSLISPDGRWRAVIREGQLVVEPVN